ncbi:MAG: NADH-quinone oxidoreductase subunit N, partial [Candidatus Omnitrophica bacterium]|nr:NADH-quinone oxidoreductase subunit N [Candidatus Omnitrophota bacterium]
MSYLEILKLALPETILALTVLLVLAVDLGVMRLQTVGRRMTVAAGITCAGCVAAIWGVLALPQPASLLDGMWVVDGLTRFIKPVLLLLTVATALLSLESRFTTHVGEYFALLLLATIGLMFMVSTEQILMIFISLELTSLSLYILTAFSKASISSSEAALKYFLFGGMSAAFLLFGLSLIYGVTGATRLTQIAAHLKAPGLDPLVMVGIAMTVIGLGFKIAAVPFHLWAPDVYQGAPTSSAALIASGSKVASFFLLAKVMVIGFNGVEGSGAWHGFIAGWAPLLAIMAALSMVLGNVAAIAQVSVKRLLAYSAIAHAGYMLLGLLADNQQGFSSLIYYVTIYGLTTVGAFGIVAIVAENIGDDKLANFAGLSRRAPMLSLCMLVFMLSLAGIPPLAGFFGKFYLFTAVLGSDSGNMGLLWLVILATPLR